MLLFSLGESQPPKCLIGLESFDPDDHCCKQMRNTEPCFTDPAEDRKAPKATKSSYPVSSYAFQLVALLDQMLVHSFLFIHLFKAML